MNNDKKLIEEVKQRFEKQRNTLYRVSIVYQKYSDSINVFFEHQKLNNPTHSVQIGGYGSNQKDRMSELAKQITKETKVSVSLVGF